MSRKVEKKINKISAKSMTTFGYQNVEQDEKSIMVGDVFSSVAQRYDLMNDLMSFGAHRLWKRAMLDWLYPQPRMRVLDMGGGTGDISFGLLKRGVLDVIIGDINSEMLNVGRDRLIDRGIVQKASWVVMDAEKLPLPGQSIDAYVTAFCLRNVTRLEVALAEARRVLKPGGRFLCLEFAAVSSPWLTNLYDTWSFKFLPHIGACVAGERGAYQYLVESIRQFPNQKKFKCMIQNAGLSNVQVRDLSGGIVAIYSAWRI